MNVVKASHIFISFFIFFLIWFLPVFADSQTFEREVVTIDDVSEKISSQNYHVLENALRVYQVKETIQVARGDLLPKLNLWKVVTVPLDPLMGMLGMIEDIAPFLVPANWFRVEEHKILYLATQEAYRALWANELMTAKSLYLKILFDLSLLEHVKKNKQQFEKIGAIAKSRETFGGLWQNVSRDIEVKILALEEDERSLEVLISVELDSLSYLMGYPGSVTLTLTPVDIPDFSNYTPLNYDDFEFRVLDSSPESREFDHLIQASDFIKKEAMFSFLGSSQMSRGVAGGVFDNLPISKGLGFGTGPSLRIIRAQKNILRLQKKGIEETLQRQLKILIYNYNADLENYANLKKRVLLTQAILDDLYRKLVLGEDIEIFDLVDASRNYIQADNAFFAVNYRLLVNEDKLSRLIFHGDYHKKPAVIEHITGGR